MKFNDLVAQISGIDGAARLSAGRTLQHVMSLRNWFIGAYIVEFEQAGEDRAAYGQNLMVRLAHSLQEAGCVGFSVRSLKNFRQIALAYPGLDVTALDQQLGLKIRQTSAESGARGLVRRSVTGLKTHSTAGTPVVAPEIGQTPAESSSSQFPSLARRARSPNFHGAMPLGWPGCLLL